MASCIGEVALHAWDCNSEAIFNYKIETCMWARNWVVYFDRVSYSVLSREISWFLPVSLALPLLVRAPFWFAPLGGLSVLRASPRAVSDDALSLLPFKIAEQNSLKLWQISAHLHHLRFTQWQKSVHTFLESNWSPVAKNVTWLPTQMSVFKFHVCSKIFENLFYVQQLPKVRNDSYTEI